VLRFTITVAPNVTDGEYSLPVTLTYQACDDSTCRAPETIETKLIVKVGSLGTPTHVDIFGGLAPEGSSEPTSGAVAVQTNELQHLVDKYGLWGYFLALGLAFVTGLLLSFSPCTYPMIPITVSIFAGQQRSLGRGFVMSLFYVGSMAVIYGIMGLVVSLVGGVFGAWLASPPVVIGIAVVFVVFSLSMFGLYELQVPMFLRQKLGATKGGGGIGGAIVLGAVAALVISPCVGPFVAGILLYIATHGSPFIGFVVLFVFALGLGTLFIIIGTFSSAINSLPRAGEWMDQVKRFFGFVLLIMALYFLRTIIPSTVMAILTGLLLLAFGVFGGGLDRLTAEAGGFARLKKYLGFISLLIGAYLLIGTILLEGLILPPASKWLPVTGIGTSQQQEQGIDWLTDLEQGLAQAKAEGRPVFIDTWATWCANCRVLEQKTFSHPDVIKAANRFVPIRVQLEKAGSDVTRSFMDRFGLKIYSLPTTLLLDSKGVTKMIRRGVISPEDMIVQMQRVK
jgi:thiol:disulfide interchange protein DsbD